jgi:2-polyprenyl-3-methyl-5-hydroxy-6-metoxy-1,4-benzoquinol methylase
MALLTAIRFNRPSHVFLGLSPHCIDEGWDGKLRRTIDEQAGCNPIVKTLVGASTRGEVALARQRLFRAAADALDAADWMITVDDDDGALGPLPLDQADDVGMVHTDICGVCREDTGPWKAGDVFIRTARRIKEPTDANYFRGSYYAYRVQAWLDVEQLIGDDTDYEEWRTVYHMMKAGWRDHYEARVLQWQGLRDYVGDATRVQAAGKSWELVQGQMDQLAKLCGHEDASGRWWQNWTRPESRKQIERYWKTGADQGPRRKHWYDVLRQIETEEYGVGGFTGRDVLDFGCGTGEDYQQLMRMGVNYTGCDITNEMMDMFRRKHGGGPKLFINDLLGSTSKDREWPIVINNAVLPHLPSDKIPIAMGELWRITDELLIIRLFGVGKVQEGGKEKSETFTHQGFLYQWWSEEKWINTLKSVIDPATGTIRSSRGPTRDTYDCMVITARRR